ncbi:hypothetical protein TNCV_2784571 [Trichonephila clavipes]|nr:hypothetical protein TNCV_2784571 [Trichonephila clavipes]
MGNKFTGTVVKAVYSLSQPDSPVCYQSVKRIINARFKVHYREKIRDSVRGTNWSSLMEGSIPYDLSVSLPLGSQLDMTTS